MNVCKDTKKQKIIAILYYFSLHYLENPSGWGLNYNLQEKLSCGYQFIKQIFDLLLLFIDGELISRNEYNKLSEDNKNLMAENSELKRELEEVKSQRNHCTEYNKEKQNKLIVYLFLEKVSIRGIRTILINVIQLTKNVSVCYICNTLHFYENRANAVKIFFFDLIKDDVIKALADETYYGSKCLLNIMDHNSLLWIDFHEKVGDVNHKDWKILFSKLPNLDIVISDKGSALAKAVKELGITWIKDIFHIIRLFFKKISVDIKKNVSKYAEVKMLIKDITDKLFFVQEGYLLTLPEIKDKVFPLVDKLSTYSEPLKDFCERFKDEFESDFNHIVLLNSDLEEVLGKEDFRKHFSFVQLVCYNYKLDKFLRLLKWSKVKAKKKLPDSFWAKYRNTKLLLQDFIEKDSKLKEIEVKILKILEKYCRSSSNIENLHSFQKPHVKAHRNMGMDYLALLYVYYNVRPCSENAIEGRKRKCPLELFGIELESYDFWEILNQQDLCQLIKENDKQKKKLCHYNEEYG